MVFENFAIIRDSCFMYWRELHNRYLTLIAVLIYPEWMLLPSIAYPECSAIVSNGQNNNPRESALGRKQTLRLINIFSYIKLLFDRSVLHRKNKWINSNTSFKSQFVYE